MRAHRRAVQWWPGPGQPRQRARGGAEHRTGVWQLRIRPDHRWLRRLAVGAAAAILVVLPSTAAFAGTSSGTPTPAASPGTSGSASQWQEWSAEQAAAATAYPWASALSGNGCTVTSVSYQSIPSPGAQIGIPKGVDFTAVTVDASCANAANSSASVAGSSTTASPLFTSPYYKCRGITDGGACIGLQAVSGSVYDLEASYTYAGSRSTYGHVELGDVGNGSCGPGTTVVDGSPEAILTQGETQRGLHPLGGQLHLVIDVVAGQRWGQLHGLRQRLLELLTRVRLTGQRPGTYLVHAPGRCAVLSSDP